MEHFLADMIPRTNLFMGDVLKSMLFSQLDAIVYQTFIYSSSTRW